MFATINRLDNIFARTCYGIMVLYYAELSTVIFLGRNAVLGGLLICQTALCLMLLVNNIRGKYYQGRQMLLFVGAISLAATIWQIVTGLMSHQIGPRGIVADICLDGFILAVLIYRYVLISTILRESSANGSDANDN